MHLKPSHRHLSEAHDPCDPAQPWLDFGRWLAGETAADSAAFSDFGPRIPSFAALAERHFRDLVSYAVHGNALELRQAMHRRFIQAIHLAFGAEDLPDLAIHQPPHIFDLVRNLRADFDLPSERSEKQESFSRGLPPSPVALWRAPRGCP